jgi:hypothetical protein
MDEVYYTLAMWRVKPGNEKVFVAAWLDLSALFGALPGPPGTGRLLQSVTDPSLYYSFGPWHKLQDIDAMRADPHAREALKRLMDLCTEAAPGTFRQVAEVAP